VCPGGRAAAGAAHARHRAVWARVGRAEQGEVFKPVNGVFTIEGAHVHEAYLKGLSFIANPLQ
jgi:hypothetical protein